MHAIHFSLVSNELFIVDAATAEAATAPALMARLRALGWPARARLLSPKAPTPAASVPGVLVELIDALPLLGQALTQEASAAVLSLAPALSAWQAAARLALELTRNGRLSIRLSPCNQAQTGGFVARWQVYTQTPAERAALLRVTTDFSAAVAVPEEASRASYFADARPFPRQDRGFVPLSAPQLLKRFLNACADTLVREASRRGALVRLKGWPATSWEQRLVRALGEDRARFFWDGADAAARCAEVNAWAEDQIGESTLCFLASPQNWSAPESMSSVLKRLSLPAGWLAETLLGGRAAPRTLRGAAPMRLAA